MELLFIGLASDGPTYEPIRFTDEKSILRAFGGSWTQRSTVSSSASSLSLSYEPYTSLSNLVDTKKQYLYSPTVSGSILYFGNIGGSGNHTVDLVYTPYLGKSDLVFSLRKCLQEVDGPVYGMRVGGTRASFDFSGWSVEGKYPGTKYNNILLTLSSTGFKVSGLEPNYATLNYTMATSGGWTPQMLRDYEMGLSPVWVKTVGELTTTFSTTLSGGLDGSFSSVDLGVLLDSLDAPSSVSHVIILTEVSSGLISTIFDHMWEGSHQPKLFLLPSPEFTSPASSWVETMSDDLPHRHNMVAIVTGDTYTPLGGRTVNRYAAEGAAIGLYKSEGFNLTNNPVPALGFTPILSESDLDLMKSRGFITLMRYIGNDISTYEGVTSSNESSFLYSSKLAEVFALTNGLLKPLIGSPMNNGRKTELESELIKRLSTINYLKIDTVQIEAFYGTLNVFINVILPTEILTINFTIQNKNN